MDEKTQDPRPQTQEDIGRGELLEQLLAAEPVLQAKLLEALETGRFFIIISFQKKYKPEDKHDLQHHSVIKGYPEKDVPATLKHLANDFIAKHNLNMDLAKDEGWH